MLSLATANVAYMAPAPASMLATGMRSSVTTMQADLQGFQDYEDTAKIFPTHLSGDIAKAKAGRALLSMVAPAAHADRDVPARAQEAAYEVAIGRLRRAGGKTEAQRLVLAEIDGGDSASV